MTARKMFEELGFGYELYSKRESISYWSEDTLTYIEFYLNSKSVEIGDDFEKYRFEPKLIQAIYKQIQELGWL